MRHEWCKMRDVLLGRDGPSLHNTETLVQETNQCSFEEIWKKHWPIFFIYPLWVSRRERKCKMTSLNTLPWTENMYRQKGGLKFLPSFKIQHTKFIKSVKLAVLRQEKYRALLGIPSQPAQSRSGPVCPVYLVHAASTLYIFIRFAYIRHFFQNDVTTVYTSLYVIFIIWPWIFLSGDVPIPRWYAEINQLQSWVLYIKEGADGE